MALAPGTIVGHYEVRDLLGSGGMGEVYSAQDQTLGRLVALKMLRQTLSADLDGVTRFLLEARAASALNHPNILTIHEVGDHQASRFIVSEFVEGETLRQRIERAALTLREILDIAIQAASALAAAHAAGIVHRDIKPENLMLRPDGYLKVLDFGVAKLAERAGPDDRAATIAPVDTGRGMVVGTVAYMSPEQARGLDVDGRADVFSVGVVLYEMLTGRTPFAGDTPTDVLVAIVDRKPPPLRLHVRGLPAQLEWIVDKALDKDPNLRYQSIADLRVDLIRLKSAIETGRVAEVSAADAAATRMADQPIEVELTVDSAPVRALSSESRATVGLAILAAAALTASFMTYDAARPGSDLPLQLPEGAVITKARDAAASLGYPGLAAQNRTTFANALAADHVAALAGLTELKEAVRAGVVAHWAVGSSSARDPNLLVGDVEPQDGEFKIRLNPNGQIVSFATGVSQTAAGALDRDRAVQLGLDTLQRVYGIDASSYEPEYLQRAFPAGVVEMTWRNPARRFGHIEQFRVNLQGDRVVRLERSFQKPPGFTEPALTPVARVLGRLVPWIVGVAFVAPVVFGLYVLFKTRNWEAIKQRLPIALCGVMLLSLAFVTVTAPGSQVLVGFMFLALVMISTGLPALGGLLFWIRRQTPARLWAADELMRGRVTSAAVSVSLVEGVMAGAVMAATFVIADLIGLQIAGFLPVISHEVGVVDQSVAMSLADALVSASLRTIGIALAVEALDRARVRPLVSTLIIALVAGLVARPQHQTFLAVLLPMAGQAAAMLITVIIYRSRGFLATWVAVAASEMLLSAMAARALGEPDRLSSGNMLFVIVALLAALGVWGLAAAYLKRRGAASATSVAS